MGLVNLQEWNTRRGAVISEFLSGRTSVVNVSALSGEGYAQWMIDNARAFKTASQKPGATRLDSAAIFVMTEGRHVWPKYSACADLAHVCLTLAGVRVPRFVNRDDDDMDGNISADEKRSMWVVSQNISFLINGAIKLSSELGEQIWVPGSDGVVPQPGTAFVIGGDGLGGPEHVGIVENLSDEFVESIDGGQVDEGGQCVKRVSRALSIKSGRPWLGSRGLMGYVDVPTLLARYAALGHLHDPRVVLPSS